MTSEWKEMKVWRQADTEHGILMSHDTEDFFWFPTKALEVSWRGTCFAVVADVKGEKERVYEAGKSEPDEAAASRRIVTDA